MTYPLATTTDAVVQVNGATALVPWVSIPADRNPALVYLPAWQPAAAAPCGKP